MRYDKELKLGFQVLRVSCKPLFTIVSLIINLHFILHTMYWILSYIRSLHTASDVRVFNLYLF